MKNVDIRAEIAGAGLYFHQVARVMGIKPNTLSVYLMHDLTDYQKTRIRAAITKASKEVKNGKKE